MSDIKWMDLNEFLNEGFLQEANRQFFHPHGLALAVTCDDETGEVTGIAGVWDYRDDPEGVIFDEVDDEKAARVMDQQDRHWDARRKMFQSHYHDVLGGVVDVSVADVQPINWKPDGPSRDQ